MSNTSGVKAGRAYIELGVNDTTANALGAFEVKMKALGKAAEKAGNRLAIIGGTVTAPLLLAVNAAGDFAESWSKFETVFGPNTRAVQAWGDAFAEEVGRSKKQITDFLAGSKDLFTPLGFDESSAVNMSQAVTRLAVDLASFNNVADTDALRDLHAALTGSGEVMKKYGIVLSETTTKQELFRMGLDPAAATETQKAQARLNIIMAGSTAAMGDAARTSGSYANQVKRLKAGIDDLAVTTGNALLPAATQLVSQAGDAVKQFGAWAGQNQQMVVTTAELGVGLLGTGVAIRSVAGAVGGLTLAMRGAAAASAFLMANPIVLTAVGIIGAGVLAVRALDDLNTVIAATGDNMGKLREKSDALRAADQLRSARLAQLSEIQNMTSAETDEAARLIKELTDRYGGFGVAIDKATGKLQAQVGWQKQLNEAMQAQTRKQIKDEIGQLQGNISSRNAAGAATASSWWRPLTATGLDTFFADTHDDSISAGEAQNLADITRIYELRKRLKDLDAGKSSALTGAGSTATGSGSQSGPATAVVSAAELEKADKRLAAIREQIAKDRRTQLQNEIAEVQQLADEQKKLIKIVLDGELARRTPNQARIAELRQQLQAVEPDKTAQIKEIQTKAAEKNAMDAAEVNDRINKQLAEIRSGETKHAEDLYFDKMEKTDPGKLKGELEGMVATAAESFQRIAAELKSAMTAANADGVISDKEKLTLRDIQDRLSGANDTFNRYRSRLEAANEAATKTSERFAPTAGAFSGFALKVLSGEGAAERTAQAAEETAKNTGELISLMQGMEATFG